MGKKEILRLMIGFRKFHEKYFANEHSLYQRLSSGAGQSPKTLIIGCSDSRVDPAIITSASPGELFIVRNVANLVPPYEKGGGVHGVSAAIEFAIINLKVENVIVLGHRQCGGIRALVTNQGIQAGGFVEQWVRVASDAKERVLSKFPEANEETLCRHCEMESIVTSLNNLKTFPFVEAAIKERDLALMGIYFDLEQGQLQEYDDKEGVFKNVELI
ncbi:MAG: carbonic anhydrase [Bdellovibrionaceae bacterium]|nr:carbonic anhydrase [Pseudobdellovibrionaceae bacterium]